MANHQTLAVWHRASALSLQVHIAARSFPHRGAPGLKSQLLRAIASIPANIAEGAGQNTPAQFSSFVTIAIGSVNEAETHMRLAAGLELLNGRQGTAMIGELDEIRRMLFGLRKHLERTRLLPREVENLRDRQ